MSSIRRRSAAPPGRANSAWSRRPYFASTTCQPAAANIALDLSDADAGDDPVEALPIEVHDHRDVAEAAERVLDGASQTDALVELRVADERHEPAVGPADGLLAEVGRRYRSARLANSGATAPRPDRSRREVDRVGVLGAARVRLQAAERAQPGQVSRVEVAHQVLDRVEGGAGVRLHRDQVARAAASGSTARSGSRRPTRSSPGGRRPSRRRCWAGRRSPRGSSGRRATGSGPGDGSSVAASIGGGRAGPRAPARWADPSLTATAGSAHRSRVPTVVDRPRSGRSGYGTPVPSCCYAHCAMAMRRPGNRPDRQRTRDQPRSTPCRRLPRDQAAARPQPDGPLGRGPQRVPAPRRVGRARPCAARPACHAAPRTGSCTRWPARTCCRPRQTGRFRVGPTLARTALVLADRLDVSRVAPARPGSGHGGDRRDLDPLPLRPEPPPVLGRGRGRVRHPIRYIWESLRDWNDLHLGSSGKGILAFLPPDEQGDILTASRTRYPGSGRAQARLRAELAAAARRGYVVSHGERFGRRRRLGADPRRPRPRHRRHRDLARQPHRPAKEVAAGAVVRAAADDLSRRLGWTGASVSGTTTPTGRRP